MRALAPDNRTTRGLTRPIAPHRLAVRTQLREGNAAMASSPSVRRVAGMLEARGLGDRIVELADSTRTAQMAASALGCRVEQIVKSLVFRGAESDRPILVVASGGNRVDEVASGGARRRADRQGRRGLRPRSDRLRHRWSAPAGPLRAAHDPRRRGPAQVRRVVGGRREAHSRSSASPPKS